MMLKTFKLTAFLAAGCLTCSTLQAGWNHEDEKSTNDEKPLASFEKPVQLMAAGSPIKVEQPGYASPAWVDMDGDGKKDLLVGQFNDGKINVFRNLGNGEFAEGEWLQANDADAQIPGVW